ncbi:MAG TPA: LPS assembly protein LptD, partial [Candidatus Angelobacter sp.]|nr:LPS assembly protein LptD [Candidatus Angelobacter sp.]
MRTQLILVITALGLCHLFLSPPVVTSQALASAVAENPQTSSPQSGNCHLVLTAPPVFQNPVSQNQVSQNQAAPDKAAPPSAQPAKQVPRISISESQPVEVNARQCEKNNNLYLLTGDVEIKFEDYTFQGDMVTYDADSGEVTTTGNAALDGGTRDIHLRAAHASYNVRSRTGKFYEVTGSTGSRYQGKKVALTSSSPILFTGKMVEQTGPDEYVLHEGSVTSCELPHPKWTFNAGTIIFRVGGSARIYNTTFRLKGVPVIYLPFVSAPVERLGRQSGFLIPNAGTSTAKGQFVGDSFYWAINRSADATLGAEYLSKRGWSLIESFRAKPSQKSFINFNYFQVLDRGIVQNVQQAGAPAGQTVPTKLNQGGEDIKLTGETTFAHDVRGVASLDYLSSFAFRLAFTDNFSQAVNSEVKSTAFASKNYQGFSLNAFGSRYQNFQSSTNNDDTISIIHVPAVEFGSVDQRIPGTPLYGSYDFAAEGLRRTELNFSTQGVVGRFGASPELSLPVHFGSWLFRPSALLNDSFYTQQQQLRAVPGQATAQEEPIHNVFNRRAIGGSLELRPPALAKVFAGEFLGRNFKHTIEPRIIYRYTNGVEKFSNIIRFDFRDILSNTNEVEFGLVQRLYMKRSHLDCAGGSTSGGDPVQPANAANLANADCAPAGADEFLTWEVKAKHFIDPGFGGAVVTGNRNVLATTVDFSGVAFLTDPRRFSPVVSKLRLRTSKNSDVQWQLDYDTKKGRINASTFYSTVHFGNFFVEGSHAYLQTPGEVVTDAFGNPLPTCVSPLKVSGPTCVLPVFNQLRALVGFGNPTKRGWSAAANTGVDSEFSLLQYSGAQTSYNWDCCGISFEYQRRFSIARLNNENHYRFYFTLANIGSFGDMKR